jgi:hypothetical protein
MKTLIMTICFQIGVDVLGFVKEFKHEVTFMVDKHTHGKHSKFAKQNNGVVKQYNLVPIHFTQGYC